MKTVCFGEIMLRLNPAGYTRFVQTESYCATYGGGEANVAVSLANYGIDSKGRVGLYVEEKNRAWTSSSPDNDNMAVTIEVANDEIGGDWHVSDKALEKLIDLCVDICKRNGIEKLNFNIPPALTLSVTSILLL